MLLHRRTLLGTAGLATTGLALGSLGLGKATLVRSAYAQDEAAALPDRAIGQADAPVVVMEYFSLTCTHCAAFARQIFPQIRTQLIETGKVRYVFKDFPLDQIALMAAMVARALPAERYEPFIMALFNTQDRWAFAKGINYRDELAKMAMLAGMPRTVFDETLADERLKKAIAAEQADAQKQFNVDSTPTFIFNGAHAKNDKQAGELSYETFAQHVTAAMGADAQPAASAAPTAAPASSAAP